MKYISKKITVLDGVIPPPEFKKIAQERGGGMTHQIVIIK